MEDLLILVDKNDQPIGTMPKMQAHKLGRLHRAFSIFLFDRQGKLLIQQRALHKYHSAGQWANSCCSHPKPDELTLDAAHRRLEEELNMSTPLTHVDEFLYHSNVNGNLIEHEYDHIYVGLYEGEITPNPDEVADIQWIDITKLNDEINRQPEKYTEWFKLIFAHYTEAKLQDWFNCAVQNDPKNSIIDIN
nr:isopentenyl-diphosphate Delta-isomerase [uncultured Moellerella sp.]